MEKVVVISGASSGIGKQLYNLYLSSGDTPICLSRTNSDGIDNHIICDVTDENSVINAIDAIKKKYGRIDTLICNAGLGLSGATELLKTAQVNTVFDTCYYGSFYLYKYSVPLMREKSKIVFISSACALFALPYRGTYCSAKAATNMLSYSVRMELKNSNIDVVCVCPGDIKTNFTKNRIKDYETNERYGNRIENAAEKIDSRENKRMNESKASKKIYKICAKKKGALYIIGAKYKFFYFMQRILPTNVFLWAIQKFFG